MVKLTLSSILVKNAELKSHSINAEDKKASEFIQETKRKQEEILKLKEVNQENLRMVVQL